LSGKETGVTTLHAGQIKLKNKLILKMLMMDHSGWTWKTLFSVLAEFKYANMMTI